MYNFLYNFVSPNGVCQVKHLGTETVGIHLGLVGPIWALSCPLIHLGFVVPINFGLVGPIGFVEEYGTHLIMKIIMVRASPPIPFSL